MDVVEFVTTYSSIEDYKVVDIYINGINFIDILYQLELPLAYQEGLPEMAGAYEGIPPLYAFPPSRHFYGQPAEAYRYDQKVSLLEYAFSGIPGDWSMVAKISVNDSSVTWSDFEQAKRRKLKNGYLWQYEELGIFTFDRLQYDEALRQASMNAY